MDEGFYVYTVRGKCLQSEVEKIITHFIVTCDDDYSVFAVKSVTYREGLRADIGFLKGYGG